MSLPNFLFHLCINDDDVFSLKEFLPQSYVKVKGVEKKVFAEHRKHVGLSELEAKVLYTKTARSLTTYGVTFFLVKVGTISTMFLSNQECEQPWGTGENFKLNGPEKNAIKCENKAVGLSKTWVLHEVMTLVSVLPFGIHLWRRGTVGRFVGICEN